MDEPKPRRRGTDKMADRAQRWVTTMWPILTVLIWLVFETATFQADIKAKIHENELKNTYKYDSLHENLQRYGVRMAKLEIALQGIDISLRTIRDSFPYIYATKEALKAKANKGD